MNRDKDCMNKLERALSELLKGRELTSKLALVLGYASPKGSLSYDEIYEMVNGSADEILLLGEELRLLLPMRTSKSAAWEDRLLLCKPGESFEIPNIIRHLVEEGAKTGQWDTERAVTNVFREMGEPGWATVPELVKRLEKQTQNRNITATQIKTICSELELEDRVDALIAELKASGVISPKLSAIVKVSRERDPVYELNPSLLLEKEMANEPQPSSGGV